MSGLVWFLFLYAPGRVREEVNVVTRGVNLSPALFWTLNWQHLGETLTSSPHLTKDEQEYLSSNLLNRIGAECMIRPFGEIYKRKGSDKKVIRKVRDVLRRTALINTPASVTELSVLGYISTEALKATLTCFACCFLTETWWKMNWRVGAKTSEHDSAIFADVNPNI